MAQQDIDQLKASVAKQRDVVGSVVTLIQGLLQQVKDSADDPEELQSVIAEIESTTQALASAVPQNTPTG